MTLANFKLYLELKDISLSCFEQSEINLIFRTQSSGEINRLQVKQFLKSVLRNSLEAVISHVRATHYMRDPSCSQIY